MDELINNRYKIIGKIGEGAFGAVYHCSDLKNTTKQLVVKVEKSRSSINHLAVESKILAATKGVSGFPKCFGLFEERDKRFLILQRLGMSISRLFKEQKKPFNLKTIVNMTMQLLQLLEELHNRDYIHRDLKPDNIMTGFVNQKQIYLIDFGVSKQYRDSTTGQHIAWVTDKTLTGSARYASINSHKGFELSRRDDIASICYICAYLYHGNLPWQGLGSVQKSGNFLQILQAKMEIAPEELFQGMPPQYIQIYQYASAMQFEEAPDYSYLYSLLNDVSRDYNIQLNNQFQWITTAERRDRNKSEGRMARDKSSPAIKFDESEPMAFESQFRQKKLTESALELKFELDEENRDLAAPMPNHGSFYHRSNKSNLSFMSGGSYLRSLAPQGSWCDERSNMTTENVYPEFTDIVFN